MTRWPEPLPAEPAGASPLWPLVLLLAEIATRVERERAAEPTGDASPARQAERAPEQRAAPRGLGRNPCPGAPRKVSRP